MLMLPAVGYGASIHWTVWLPLVSMKKALNVSIAIAALVTGT